MAQTKSLQELRGSPRTSELIRTVWDYMNVSTPEAMLPKVPVILVPGCGDTLTAQRAAELYHMRKGDKILFSGKSRPGFVGEITEARILANRALALRVPESALLLEEKSQNTGQNIALSYELLKMHKIKVNEMIVVQKPYSLARIRATLMRQWPSDAKNAQPKFYMSALERDPFDYLSIGHYGEMNATELIGNMLADFQRMHIWTSPPNDFMVKPEVAYGKPTPKKVKEAYLELVEDGFVSPRILRDAEGRPLEI